MNVLHVAPSLELSYGGPTQSLAGFLAASRSAGISASVAGPLASPTETAALEEAGAENVFTFRSQNRGALAFSPSLVRWIGANAQRFDVVHVHGLFNLISTLSARKGISRGAAVVIRPFGTMSRYTALHRRGATKRMYFALFERHNIALAAGLHFTTEAEKEEARWRGIDVSSRAHVVPPAWVQSEPLPPVAGGRPCAEVLFLGRLNPVKNIEALIDAWPVVLRAIPDARLVIAGSGDQRYSASLEDRVTRAGIERSVSFSGFVSGGTKAAVLASASVFALPSHHENFGMAAVEAIAAGLPVVVSPHVQLRDFIVRHGLGLVSSTGPASMGEALIAALRSHELRTRVAEQGRRLVEEHFGPDAIGKRLLTMYLAAGASTARTA